jgi:hypothetical protein
VIQFVQGRHVLSASARRDPERDQRSGKSRVINFRVKGHAI